MLGTKGFVLGISVAHILADLRSSYDMVQAWAQLYNDSGSPPTERIHNRYILYQQLKDVHHDPTHEEETRRSLAGLIPQQQQGFISRAVSMVESLWEAFSSQPMSVMCFVVADSELEEQKTSLLEEHKLLRFVWSSVFALRRPALK